MKHEFHVWVATPEFTKHIDDRAMPGYRRGDLVAALSGVDVARCLVILMLAPAVTVVGAEVR
jgi:hypothetical protein